MSAIPQVAPEQHLTIEKSLAFTASRAADSSVTDDTLVIFVVLSKSNTKADHSWQRKVYASVPDCQRYVAVSLRQAEVVVATGWTERRIRDVDAAVDLPALGLALPLANIYRYTPVGVADC